jgi:hypothetical protein
LGFNSEQSQVAGSKWNDASHSSTAQRNISVRVTHPAHRSAKRRGERGVRRERSAQGMHQNARTRTPTPRSRQAPPGPHQDLTAALRAPPTLQQRCMLTEQRGAPEAQHSHTGAGQGGGCCLGGLDRCRVLGATSRRVTASPTCAMYADGRQRLAAMKQGGRWRRGGAVGRWAAARAASAKHDRHEGIRDEKPQLWMYSKNPFGRTKRSISTSFQKLILQQHCVNLRNRSPRSGGFRGLKIDDLVIP